MKTTNQTSVASDPRALNDHEVARTRYNAWSQQWWNNNFREGEHDDFIIAAALAGFRREVKLNYGPESVDRVPVMPEEIRNVSINNIGKRGHEADDNFAYKTASFTTVHVLDDDADAIPRPTKCVRRVSRDKPNSTRPKVQPDELLRGAELDEGDTDSSVPTQRPQRAPTTNPFRKNFKLVVGNRLKTKASKRRRSQVSYADNSYMRQKAENSDNGHHFRVNDSAHKVQSRSPRRARSGSADSPLSLDSNITLGAGTSP